MSQIKIGIIGDFDPQSRTHPRTNQALEHAAAHIGRTISLDWIPTEQIASQGTAALEGCAAIVCSPGSPYRSMEGALEGIRLARERGYPFAGT